MENLNTYPELERELLGYANGGLLNRAPAPSGNRPLRGF